MRPIRYQAIADDLRQRLASEEFTAARVLPSESEMSESYGASRVTIRRALEVLRAEGLVESRQGFGWLVAGEPLRQDLSRLDTLEAQLSAAGIRSERRILSFGFVRAPEQVNAILGCRDVLAVRRLNLADGEPFAIVTVWCPEGLGASLSRDDVQRASFLEQLPVELGGATQTIGAELAEPEVAGLLQVPVGSPVLVAERVTRSTEGKPVLMSEHVIPAHRTRFVVELPVDDGSLLPAGMRLVD
ncbi:MAG TPA: GntR family transcriptional regulator [Microthrixaceae bacterium]|nr:GntR family transcriptional regulator [Microthrixaceae bacterium]